MMFRILLTVLLLLFILNRVDVTEVIEDMRQANLTYVGLAVLFYALAVLMNGFKWGVLLKAQGIEIPWSAVIRYTFVGTFFNSFLPGAIGGDLMRGYEVARDTNRSADAAVSVVVDRLIGLIVTVATAVLAVLYAQVQQVAGSEQLSATFWIVMLATVGLLAAFLLMISRRFRLWIGQIVDAFVARLPILRPLAQLYESLSRAIGAYRYQPKAILAAFAIGASTWIFSNLVNYLLSLSLPLTADGASPISLLDIFIFNPLVGLTQTLPISIGGLGANQTFYDLFYHTWSGYNQEHVAATSILMQFVVYFTSLLGGIIWWFDRGVKEEEGESGRVGEGEN